VGHEKSTVTISGAYLESLENTWVTTNHPEKDHAMIAYNYLS
jgi:hypothetical protein